MRQIIFIVAMMCSASTFAADSGGGSAKGSLLAKGASAWFVIGAGTITPNSATKAELDYTSNLAAMGGGDLPLVGPFFASLSAFTSTASGKINYLLTDANKNTYSANNVSVTHTMSGLNLGLQVRLVNGSRGHVFVEGGEFVSIWNMSYDFTNATNIAGTATVENSQNSIYALGTYANAGIDLIFNNGYGLRLFGRATRGQSSTIDALNGQKLNYVTGEAYIGMVRQF